MALTCFDLVFLPQTVIPVVKEFQQHIDVGPAFTGCLVNVCDNILSILSQQGHLLHNETFLCDCFWNRLFLSCPYRRNGGCFRPWGLTNASDTTLLLSKHNGE